MLSARPFCITLWLAAASSFSLADSSHDIVTLTIENDLFIGEDNGYTNGTYLSWAHGGFDSFTVDNLPNWLHALGAHTYISTLPGKQRAVSYLVGQAMQTPSDITTPELINNDAPYVGMLLGRASLHAFDERVADKLSFVLGLVGPAAGAGKSQKFFHQLVDADEPKGWHNQIHNELGFHVSAERLWRLASGPLSGRTGFDVIGLGSAGIGTLKSNAATGLGFRIGRGLDRSFPAATILPGREINPLAGSVAHSWSLFFNLLGEYVANDISIDGNTFTDSHSVPLKHWQAQAVVGLSFNWERWAFLFSTVAATDRHEHQDDPGHFGSLSVTYHF